jgi:hypothetical protein
MRGAPAARTAGGPRPLPANTCRRTHPPPASPPAAADADAPSPPQPPPLLTLADVRADAAAAGLDLAISSLGPAFRIECRRRPQRRRGGPDDEAQRSSGHGTSSPDALLARLGGALFPPWAAPWAGGIAHIDALEVWNRALGREERRALLAAVGPAGLGGLLARAAFAHAAEAAGCATAEALAILDDEATHARLVSAYKRVAGFREVAFVSGSRLADVPHMLVWGGAGTRLDADIPAALARWGAARARARAREGAGRAEDGEATG